MLTKPTLFRPYWDKPYKFTVLLILLVTAWHLFLAGRVDLSVDEAHYALYGLKPDLSYFDHPPMVGWLNSLVVNFSQTETALRVIPAVFFAASNLILYQIAVRLYGEFKWVGFWTVALINSAFMFQLLGITMLPDTPLILASLLVFWALLNLRESPLNSQASFNNWIQIGFWLGIAALSKYTAITLVFSLLIVMLAEKRWYWFKDKGLWVAIVLSALLISPIILWNIQHDWVSILYQLNHGTHNDNWLWQRAINTQLAQVGVYSILLYGVGIWLMLSTWWQPNKVNRRLLSAFSLPIIVLFALNSGYEMSLPHWTQLAWLIISPAVIFWVWRFWQKFSVRALVISSTLISLAISLPLNSQLAVPWMPLEENKNITRELHGWPKAVQTAKKWQAEYDNAPLFASNWTQASRIAWYARPAKVYVTDNRFDQFDLWFANPPSGSNGILIVPSYEDLPPLTGTPGHFKNCIPLQQQAVKYDDITLVTYHFFFCQDFIPVQYEGWVKQLPFLKNSAQQ